MPMSRRRLLTTGAASAVVVATLAAVVAATGSPQQRPLTIYAAASLTDAFGSYDAGPRYSFGGSSTLETQIRNDAPADLFASAAPLHTQRLYRKGLVRKPVAFTTNRLALIVPRSNPAGIRSVYDLQRKPVKLVVAAPSVPAGRYTRTVLRRLGLSSVLSKVVSREPDVRAVAGKVALGQADAGFVYVTDARAVRKRVTAISLPERAQPSIRYEIAVVSRSTRKAAARAWISRLLSAKGQAALRSHGFLPPPRSTR
jgi:molybdate transport system substrate-binding protein